jgi:outer membrane protein TolC
LTAIIGLADARSASPQEVAGDELTLGAAVARAHETHPSVAAARAGEDAAYAAVGRANSAWWPALGGQAAFINYSEPMLVAPLHGFTQEELQRIEFERTLIQGSVGLSWTLFDGGARTGRIRGAKANAAGASAGRESIGQMLTARVTVAYLKVLTARGVLEAKDQRIASLQSERQRVEQLLTEGQAARVELLRVDAALAQADAERVATATRLDLAERDLARLADVPLEVARFDNLVPIHLITTEMDDRAQLVARATSNNPELARAMREVEAAEADHRVAKGAWIPSFDVSGGYQAFSSDAGNVSPLWSVGLTVSYPLFTGFSRSQTVGKAGAQARMAREELRQAELQIQEEVDRALNVALETRALVEAFARAVQHQAEVARIERLSLDAGAGTQTDYLRAEAELSRVRSLLVEAQHAQIAARAQLARVVGELTPEWLDGNLEIAR